MYSCLSFTAKSMCMLAWCVCVHVCDHLNVGSNELHPWRTGFNGSWGKRRSKGRGKVSSERKRLGQHSSRCTERPLCTSGFIVAINPILDQIFKEAEKLTIKHLVLGPHQRPHKNNRHVWFIQDLSCLLFFSSTLLICCC